MSPSISTDDDGGHPLDAVSRPAATHFRMWFLAAFIHVVDELSKNLGGLDEVLEQFPFVREYLDEIDSFGAPDKTLHGWIESIHQWESAIEQHLPVRALRDALDLDDRTLTLLFAIGLIEEDPRFGFLVECAQPVPAQQHRPSLALLTAWWRDSGAAAPVRDSIRTLLDHGLIQTLNADAPRLQWVFQSPPAVWDALRDEMPSVLSSTVTFTKVDELPDLDDLVLDESSRREATTIPELIRSGDVKGLILRGPQHNGRRSVARAIAARLDLNVLEVRGPIRPDDEQWSVVGALATLAHAMPIIVLDLNLGETSEIPPLRALRGPVAAVLGRHGSVNGDGIAGAVTLNINMPRAEERHALWLKSLPEGTSADVGDLARRFRLTSGNIHTAATLAHSYARLDRRDSVDAADVRIASRAMHRQIETLATFIPTSGNWDKIGASADTIEELRNLESRCRNREQLCQTAMQRGAGPMNCGVRALFAGSSGTGKTMAAGILASTLQVDLYRLSLPNVVSRYVGDMEKRLHELLSGVEELNIVLLIDEGDAIMTARTAVQSANDRWANLETNFLLQRLESFDGVVIVTTNAANRIDSAFQRRMDVVVEFHMPDPHERWTIWQLHLPADHRVDYEWLQEAAIRCELSGGQIRNAVLHASLLAIDRRTNIGTEDVERAVRREYLKAGAVCPLPELWTAGV